MHVMGIKQKKKVIKNLGNIVWVLEVYFRGYGLFKPIKVESQDELSHEYKDKIFVISLRKYNLMLSGNAKELLKGKQKISFFKKKIGNPFMCALDFQ